MDGILSKARVVELVVRIVFVKKRVSLLNARNSRRQRLAYEWKTPQLACRSHSTDSETGFQAAVDTDRVGPL